MIYAFSVAFFRPSSSSTTFGTSPRLLTATPSTESSAFSTSSSSKRIVTPTNSLRSTSSSSETQATPPRLRNHALKMKFLADLEKEQSMSMKDTPSYTNYSSFKGGNNSILSPPGEFQNSINGGEWRMASSGNNGPFAGGNIGLYHTMRFPLHQDEGSSLLQQQRMRRSSDSTMPTTSSITTTSMNPSSSQTSLQRVKRVYL